MVQIILRALLAAGITACIGAAAAVGFLSLVPLHERDTSQPAEEQSVSDPPPLVTAIDDGQLE